MLKRPRVAYYFTSEQDKADVSQGMKAVAKGRIPSDLSQEFSGSSSLLNSRKEFFRPLLCLEKAVCFK